MPLPNYPASLKCPASMRVIPVDHRISATPERPRESRAGQLAPHWTVEAEWPPLTPDEVEIFREWWKTELVFGGSWFAATWPSPRGSVPLEIKFRTTPSYPFIPGGMFKPAAVLEVRFGGSAASAPPPPPDFEAFRWNPADKFGNVVLSNANARATVLSGLGSVRSIVSHNAASANRYAEMRIERTDPEAGMIQLVGIGTALTTLSIYPGGSDGQSFGYYSENGSLYNWGGILTPFYGDTFGIGTPTIGVHLSGGVLRFFLVDGSGDQGVAVSGLSGQWFLMWGPGTAGSSERRCDLNTGPTFLGPVPSGALAWDAP